MGTKLWGVHHTMIDSYLCEFMWRRRNVGRDPFDTIIRDLVAHNPPN